MSSTFLGRNRPKSSAIIAARSAGQGDGKQPWERLPNETSLAYEAFCIYRDLGPDRTLRRVFEILNAKRKRYTTVQQINEWSSAFGWVARSRAYDEYLDEMKRKVNEKAIIHMCRRHAWLALHFQRKVALRLQQLDPSKLTPNDLIRWFEVAVKIERLSRGEPTEIGKQEVSGQVGVTSERRYHIVQELLADPVVGPLLVDRIRSNFRSRIGDNPSPS